MTKSKGIGRGGARPGSGRKAGTLGGGPLPRLKKMRVGEAIIVTVAGPQFAGHPIVEQLVITALDREGKMTASREDGTVITIQ